MKEDDIRKEEVKNKKHARQERERCKGELEEEMKRKYRRGWEEEDGKKRMGRRVWEEEEKRRRRGGKKRETSSYVFLQEIATHAERYGNFCHNFPRCNGKPLRKRNTIAEPFSCVVFLFIRKVCHPLSLPPLQFPLHRSLPF
jgi:hypothetical protein